MADPTQPPIRDDRTLLATISSRLVCMLLDRYGETDRAVTEAVDIAASILAEIDKRGGR